MATDKITCLIVDGNQVARETMKKHLSAIEDVLIIGITDSAEDALFIIMESHPDVVFTDVMLSGRSGLKLVEVINQNVLNTRVVFVTSSDRYAIEAIKNAAAGYLLKPTNAAIIEEVLNKIRESSDEKNRDVIELNVDEIDKNSKLKISTTSGFLLIKPEDIIYCMADGAYSIVFLSNQKKELTNFSLRKLSSMLAKYNFIRANRSVLINLAYLKRIDKLRCFCYLSHNGTDYKIKMSRFQIKNFLEEPLFREHISEI